MPTEEEEAAVAAAGKDRKGGKGGKGGGGKGGRQSGGGKKENKEAEPEEKKALTDQERLAAWKKVTLKEMTEAAATAMMMEGVPLSDSILSELNGSLKTLKTGYNAIIALQKQEQYAEAGVRKLFCCSFVCFHKCAIAGCVCGK